MPNDEILIVAGENSGDLHAAELVKNFTQAHPEYSFFGAGGELMKSEGVELLAHVNDLAVMGFSGIPRILPALLQLKRVILKRVRDNNVKLAILVDYPGFNLNLAKGLKSLTNPPRILEFIAPQVWAWRPSRVKKIRAYIDHLAVVFPFEESLFKAANIPVTFVGHPLLDELEFNSTTSGYNGGNLETKYHDMSGTDRTSKPILALLPGSRKSVTARHLPIIIKSVKLFNDEFPDIRFCIGCAPGLKQYLVDYTSDISIKFEYWDDSRELLAKATAAVVCSGTATLEAALIGAPHVIVYKTSYINYMIIKNLIKLPYIGLVNIVAENRIVPELIQNEFNPSSLFRALSPILRHRSFRNHFYERLLRVKYMLGEPGASHRVSELAYKMIESNS